MVDDFELMVAGDFYQPGHLIERIVACRELMLEYNALGAHDGKKRREILQKMLGAVGKGCVVVAPFHCDYGTQIHLADKVFVNYDCTFLDEAPIRIGARSLIGPQVGIYTAQHPLDENIRSEGYETAAPVTIGQDVWVGGHATILPGVTIADGAIVAAGAVVVRDVAPRSIVAGNPARAIREITEQDCASWQKLKSAYLEAVGE